MNANELMVGDWVLINKSPDSPYYKQFGIEDFETDKYQYCEPIPLTREILEKNGFVKYNEVSDTPPYDKDEEGNMYYSYKGEQKFWGWWQPNNVYLIPVNAMLDLEIKYVHELQHALRLCGINKEIEI